MKKRELLVCFMLLISGLAVAQTLEETQMRNARATGYAIVAARNPGKSFSVFVIPWDGVNTLEYNANTQINISWHAQAAVKGNYFNQSFDGTDFSQYSSVALSQAEFDQYKSAGTQWWIVCCTLPPFSGALTTDNGNDLRVEGNVEIGTTTSVAKLDVNGRGVFGDILSSRGSNGNALVVANKANEATSLFLWQNNVGSGHIGFRPNDNNLYIVNSYTDGLIANPAAITLNSNGNVGIGTANPAYKLDVLGTIRAKEVLVDLNGVPDYVFAKDYKLLPIEQVSTYVQENHHLPEIPSAAEMEKGGVSLNTMQLQLLKKVEELTLYAIEQQKEIQALKEEMRQMKK